MKSFSVEIARSRGCLVRGGGEIISLSATLWRGNLCYLASIILVLYVIALFLEDLSIVRE